jgi:hypothetical protein
MKVLRRFAVLPALMLIGVSCSPDRLVSPGIVPHPTGRPTDLLRNVTGACVIGVPPLTHDSTNTSTYRIFNASCYPVFNALNSLEQRPSNVWWNQQGKTCYVTSPNTEENMRCFAYPDPSGIGPIPMFIYSIPVPSYIIIRFRNGVTSKTFERSRFLIRTKSAVIGVRA